MRHTAGNTDALYYDGSLLQPAAYNFSFVTNGGSAGTLDVYLDEGPGTTFPYSASFSNCTGTGQWFSGYPAKIVFYPSSDFDGYIDTVSVKRAPSIQEVPSNNHGGNPIYGRQGNSWVGITGASGTFTTADSKTVTVTNGLITSIV